MAPPSSKPRLSDFTPQQAAVAACEDVLGHLMRVAFAMHLDVTGMHGSREVTAESAAASSTLGLTVQQMTHYAQTGEAGDWADDVLGAVVDATNSILSSLYDNAAEGGALGPLDASSIDEAKPYGVAVRAAWARAHLEAGTPAEPAWFAALVGLSPTRVRELGRLGEIGDTAAEQLDWAKRRGVVGL